MQEEKKTEVVSTIITSQDPQDCYNKVSEFSKSKVQDDLTFTWNTTPLLIPQSSSVIGGMMQSQTIIVTTCLIFWRCTPEQAVSFRNQQRLQIQS